MGTGLLGGADDLDDGYLRRRADHLVALDFFYRLFDKGAQTLA